MVSDDSEVLEKKLEQTLNLIDLIDEERLFIQDNLYKLKEKHVPTCNHSIRVLLNSVEVAEIIRLEPKILAYAGGLHDIGKLETDLKYLEIEKNFSKEDMIELKKHPKAGYDFLIDTHPFTAEVIIRSHRFGKDPYPNELPTTINHYSFEDRALINYCSRIISLLDFYDACLYRKNDRNSPGNPRLLTPEEAKKVMFEENQDQKYLIKGLSEKGIFDFCSHK